MKTVPKAILDTDILSAIMRRNPLVIPKATEYLSQHSQFTFSLITRYEILRGLKAKNAIKQLKSFDEFCCQNIILPPTDEIIVQAADIYADLRTRGLPIGDADILIGATAIIFNLVVITNNESHFCRIPTSMQLAQILVRSRRDPPLAVRRSCRVRPSTA